ncbi:MAG: glycosyltransferase [Phycisphaerae bacterium]|jgi:SAM-dependent methyltransferase
MTTTPENLSDAAVAAGAEYDRWRRRNAFYYGELIRLYRRHVPPGSRVLEIGCGAGDLLAALRPSYGLGVDEDPALIEAARRRHPGLHFAAGPLEAPPLPEGETFDAIVICNVIGHLRDVQAVFTALRRYCRPDTRVIATYHNAVWEPLLRFGSRVGLRRPTVEQNWLSRDDIENLFDLSGFEVIRPYCEILLPVRVPGVSELANRFLVKFWPFKHLGLAILMVARPRGPAFDPAATRVSVIIPTRNERGNVAAAVRRTPDMGAGTEIIFVDGWSTDGTVQEIRRVMAENPGRSIRLIAQEGKKGKGQAVRQGFAAASGDLLMILDADLTVAPEELPKFFRALCDGLGEFANGTRLVYPMHQRAMRFLNKLGNKFFSVLFTWLIGQRFRDTLCGTKALSRRHYERIAATRGELGDFDPFGDFDLIFGAARNDLKIIEIPVRYGERTYGATNISRFRDGLLLLRMSWTAFLKVRLR